MTRARASATLLVAHVVLFVLTVWSAATQPGAPRTKLRLEPVHTTTALVAARPTASNDVGRRETSPLSALPSPCGFVSIAAAPSRRLPCPPTHAEQLCSRALSHATARGPPQTT